MEFRRQGGGSGEASARSRSLTPAAGMNSAASRLPSVIGGALLSRPRKYVVPAGNQRPLLTWPLKIRRIEIIVFQFRVVAGTPYSLSI